MESDKDLKPLEGIIGFAFKDQNRLRQALTHRSYLNEHADWPLPHNERLEFLGDAVLELVVTDHLFHTYELPEGEMTNLRAAVVRGQMLSKIAVEMELDDYLLLSRGERKDTGKARQYILANAVEAVLGALYLDGGYEAAKAVIDTFIVSKLDEVVEKGLHVDNKSKFQELAQEQFRITPTYQVLEEIGLDHEKEFTVGAFLGTKMVGKGNGRSKQEAQQSAAKIALQELQKSGATL